MRSGGVRVCAGMNSRRLTATTVSRAGPRVTTGYVLADAGVDGANLRQRRNAGRE